MSLDKKMCVHTEMKNICVYYNDGRCYDINYGERSCEECLRTYREKIFKAIEDKLMK